MRAHEFVIGKSVEDILIECMFENEGEYLLEIAVDKSELIAELLTDSNLITPTTDLIGTTMFPVSINILDAGGALTYISMAYYENDVILDRIEGNIYYFKNPVTNNITPFPPKENIGVRLVYPNVEYFNLINTKIALKYGFDSDNKIITKALK